LTSTRTRHSISTMSLKLLPTTYADSLVCFHAYIIAQLRYSCKWYCVGTLR
jgi:hypothetical protein